MAGKSPVVVYWDTVMFISLFNGFRGLETEDAEAVRYWRRQADDGDALILTSSLTYAEVLEVYEGGESGLVPAQYRSFDAFMTGRIEIVDAHVGIMRRVKEIRQRARDLPKAHGQKHKLCTPDAIHLATAASGPCSEFHTFDGSSSKGCTGLLRLAEHAPALGLSFHIKKPAVPPGDLDLFEP